MKSDFEVLCIVPTLNEEATIEEIVRLAKRFAHRVIVVDGFSTDNTYNKAINSGAEVIFQEGKGKGSALRTVFEEIRGDYIYVTIDGDATYDPLEMSNIIKPIIEDEADIVVGSRLQGKMEDGSISRTNIIGNKIFNFFINIFFKGKITDSQSGYRAMTRKAIDILDISSEGFEVETEITIKALKGGLDIIEVPITYRRRRGSSTKLRPLRDGSRIMITILKNLFSKDSSMQSLDNNYKNRISNDDIMIKKSRELDSFLKIINERENTITS
jgi:dolichol-phosphate mannosyltransferase